MDAHAITGVNVKSWSQCSLMAIDRFLKYVYLCLMNKISSFLFNYYDRLSFEIFYFHYRTDGRCLYNMPNLNQRVTPFLPGKMMDANQQCRVLQGTQSSRIDASICHELLCYIRNSAYMSVLGEQYAAPGTRCGYQKMCIHGKCVPEIVT